MRATVKILTVFVTAALWSPTAAQPTSSQPSLVGKWNWAVRGKGGCREVWEFRANGTATIESSEEVLTETYETFPSPNAPTHFKLSSIVVSTNGKSDCLGRLTAVGSKRSIFIVPTVSGNLLTCWTDNTRSCIGLARPER